MPPINSRIARHLGYFAVAVACMSASAVAWADASAGLAEPATSSAATGTVALATGATSTTGDGTTKPRSDNGSPAKTQQPAVPAADDSALDLTILGNTTLNRVGEFATDSRGGRSNEAPALDARLRLRLHGQTPARTGGWYAEGALAGDAVDGTLWQTSAPARSGVAPGGSKLPFDRLGTFLPQEAWLAMRKGHSLGLQVGLMASQWGAGLVADDGTQGLTTDRNPWLTSARSGDRVARALLYAMPFAQSQSWLRGLLVSAAVDSVLDDDIADRTLGERATQYVLASKLYMDPARWVGVYVAHREQRHDDGKTLSATIVDAALDMDFRDAAKDGLRIVAEGAWITGETTLGATADHPVQSVSQFGALGRAAWSSPGRSLVLELDAGYASGDSNLDDGVQSAFRADRNLRQGLILFERVLAYQTGRTSVHAANPDLVGVPPQDLDRLASEGTIFNAITIFPRIGSVVARPAGIPIEVYGGVLVAFAPKPPTDAFTTKVDGGGWPRNALGATPNGRLLGTEFDFGVRARWDMAARSALQLAAEYGFLIPGGALQNSAGDEGNVQAMRLTLSLLGR